MFVWNSLAFSVIQWMLDTKKAEHQRIDAFELWCWRRLLRVPWTARRSNQSVLKEISPECSLEGLMLKLKLQYFGHWWPLIWKDPDAGKDWGLEEKGTTEDEVVGCHHWLNEHELVNSRCWWWTAHSWCAAGVAKSQTQLSNWTELIVREWLSRMRSVISVNQSIKCMVSYERTVN